MSVSPAVRSLPPLPSLEYERKEAKALLRRLRVGDPEALVRARARHAAFDSAHPQLADAQLVVAREYGFTSWPRLVHYFDAVERQRHTIQQLHHDRDFYDGSVQSLMRSHGARRVWAGRVLAAYVPRFYGLRVDEVFASNVTEDDARLATARQYGAPNWEVLLERVDTIARSYPADRTTDPFRRASAAMAAGDLDVLAEIVAGHPQLLHPTAQEATRGRTLMTAAVQHERQHGVAAMQPVIAWLEARGFDRQRELNDRLCGHMRMTPDEVRDLLGRGADPSWVPPNGIPVLEHALLRYWNRDAVDMLAARTTPRRALWIAAGLGDVDGVRGFLDRDGRPTLAARRLRPDFDAAGPRGLLPPLPDAEDEEILVEALLVAMLNGRTAVIEHLASRGAPLDSMIYGSPLLNVAVGNAMVDAVDALVRCGADLDLRGWQPSQTPREIARHLFEQMPTNADRRRIAEICGLDPDALLAVPAPAPEVDSTLRRALTLASDDAARLGQSDVTPENLLFGLVRAGGPPFHFLVDVGRMDGTRFRAELSDRLDPPADGVVHPERPLHPDAQAAMDAAIAHATARRRGAIYGLHLLHALTRTDDGAVGQLLTRYGVNVATLHSQLETGL